MKKKLQAIARKIYGLKDWGKFFIRVTWVPREENYYADFLSKLKDWDDWGLSQELFDLFSKTWDPFTIDLFCKFDK